MITKPKMMSLVDKKPGQRVSRKSMFGEGGSKGTRYAVYAVMSRFGNVEWFVDDAETPCDCCGTRPKIIRQAADFGDAVAGL